MRPRPMRLQPPSSGSRLAVSTKPADHRREAGRLERCRPPGLGDGPVLSCRRARSREVELDEGKVAAGEILGCDSDGIIQRIAALEPGLSKQADKRGNRLSERVAGALKAHAVDEQHPNVRDLVGAQAIWVGRSLRASWDSLEAVAPRELMGRSQSQPSGPADELALPKVRG